MYLMNRGPEQEKDAGARFKLSETCHQMIQMNGISNGVFNDDPF